MDGGQNYYNLTFRNQTFAGIHLGTDDITVMGGAEHDQNKYVDCTFINTDDYGFYCNSNMLDKWLLLNAEFRGQHAAGISIKYNNVIKGAIIGCRFTAIDVPALGRPSE